MTDAPSIFTKTSAFSLAGVLVIFIAAYSASHVFLPKNAKWQNRYTFIWLVRMNISELKESLQLTSINSGI
jgi:hypothetical protein